MEVNGFKFKVFHINGNTVVIAKTNIEARKYYKNLCNITVTTCIELMSGDISNLRIRDGARPHLFPLKVETYVKKLLKEGKKVPTFLCLAHYGN